MVGTDLAVDFTPSNILLKVEGLDGLPDDEVLKILGDPVKVDVFTELGETPSDPTAPKYLVRPVEFRNVPLPYVVDEILVIDFGESYDVTNPPEELGIPESYRPPELVLENTPGFGCDLWALGCTLFEIRTGRKLFDMFDDDVDSHLFHMVEMLGALPEPWWSTTWKHRKEFFKDETDSLGRAVLVDALAKEQSELSTGARSIEWALRRGLHYWDLGPGEEFSREIPPDEIEQLADLLKKILQYEPSCRLTVAETLEHEWFSIDRN
jgi:serine/threonine protein kinase